MSSGKVQTGEFLFNYLDAKDARYLLRYLLLLINIISKRQGNCAAEIINYYR